VHLLGQVEAPAPSHGKDTKQGDDPIVVTYSLLDAVSDSAKMLSADPRKAEKLLKSRGHLKMIKAIFDVAGSKENRRFGGTVDEVPCFDC
jgi:hypothetical protein